MFLYIITNQVNKKQYVGITKNPKDRWALHRCGHGSKLVFAAIRKYGQENFTFDILYDGPVQEIQDLEITTIATLETRAPLGYNLTEGGEGTSQYKPGKRQKPHSKETKQKISKSLTGKKQSPETVEKRRKKIIGKQRTEEQRAKYSASHIGVCHTPEVVERIRLKNLGRQQSEKERKKRSQTSGKARPVVLYGVEYSCLSKAANAQGLNESTLARWFRNWNKENHWPKDCHYLDRN